MKERFAIQEQEKWLKRSQRPETTGTDAVNKVKEAGAFNQFLERGAEGMTEKPPEGISTSNWRASHTP